MPQEQQRYLLLDAGDGEAGCEGAISLLHSVEGPAETCQRPQMEEAYIAAILPENVSAVRCSVARTDGILVVQCCDRG